MSPLLPLSWRKKSKIVCVVLDESGPDVLKTIEYKENSVGER